MPNLRLLAPFTALLLAISAGRAAQEQDSSSPKFQTTTQLVEIAVSATAKNGSWASGLRRGDFRVTSNGKQYPIALFQAGGSRTSQPANVAPHYGKFFQDVSLEQATNRNIVLVDIADMDAVTWQRGWPQVLRFLKGLNPAGHIAIYILSPTEGLQVVQDFGDDPHPLLSRLAASADPSIESLFPQALSDPGQALSFSSRIENPELPQMISLGRTQGIVNTFHVVADHLADVPGTKSLVWFSGRFPNAFQPEHDAATEAARIELLRAVRRLIAANVSIYPIDARGLPRDPTLDVDQEYLPEPSKFSRAGPAANLPLPTDISVISEFAQESGGKAYYNTNGLAEAMNDAAQMGSRRYLLGFYPTGKLDDKFHHVRIEVSKPGIRLKYKPGYWALTPQPPANPADALKSALESPFIESVIRVEADAARDATNHMPIRVYVDPKNVKLINAGGDSEATLDIAFGQKDQLGRVFVVPPFHVVLRRSQSAIASHTWLTTQVTLPIRDKSRFVRVVVRDAGSGNVGSIDIPCTDRQTATR